LSVLRISAIGRFVTRLLRYRAKVGDWIPDCCC